jgi:hypothetical protein
MNKVFFLLFFFFCLSVTAQDTLATAEPTKMVSKKFTQKDIQIDTTSLEVKSFTKNFKKKYTGSDFVYQEQVPEKNAWDRFKEWLAAILRNIFHFNSNETSLNFITIALKTVAVLVIVFVIYLLAKAFIGREGQWIFGKNANKKTIYYSDTEKNIHLFDFEKLIAASLQSGEKRTAIRYYYLWLLKIMAQNQYIEWDIEKTNSDYLYELQRPAHKEEFTYLSYLYNYIWYGEFEIDQTSFEKAENRFKNALKTFGNE